MKLKWSALFFALMLTGCATTKNYQLAVNSWQGANENQLFGVWGYPNRIQKLPNGHRLLLYRTHYRGRYPIVTIPGYTSVRTQNNQTMVNSQPSMVSGGGSYDLQCVTWFEVNRKGVILQGRFRGNNCEGAKSFVRAYAKR